MKKIKLSLPLCFIAVALILGMPVSYAQTPGNRLQSYSFQYTSATLSSGQTGTVVNAWSSQSPPKWYTLSISGTATPVNVALDGSLDNANWSPILITTSYTGNISNSIPYPFIYFRVRAASVTANNFVTATAIGTW